MMRGMARTLLLAVAALALGACAHRASNVALGDDELERRWSDDERPGRFDGCEVLRVAQGATSGPARAARRIACQGEPVCRAKTASIAVEGHGWDPAVVVRVLDAAGFALVERGGEAVVQVTLDADVRSTSWALPCDEPAGCAQPRLETHTTYRTWGLLRLLDGAGAEVARAPLDGDGFWSTGSAPTTVEQVAGLEAKLLAMLAEHRGGAMFRLALSGSPFSWTVGPALRQAPNDWGADGAARALLPALLDDAARTGDTSSLALIDPDWACSPELEAPLAALAPRVAAAPAEDPLLKVAAFSPAPAVTEAFCARGARDLAQGRVDPAVLRALRHRDAPCANRLLVDLAPRTFGPFETGSLDVAIQYWLAIRARADQRGRLSSPEAALRWLAGDPGDLARALDWLAEAKDPRAAPLLAFPLYFSSTRNLKLGAIAALRRRGSLRDALALARYHALPRDPASRAAAWLTIDAARAALDELATPARLAGQALSEAELRQLLAEHGDEPTAVDQVLRALSDETSARVIDEAAAAAPDPLAPRWLAELAAARCLPRALARLGALARGDQARQLLERCQRPPAAP